MIRCGLLLVLFLSLAARLDGQPLPREQGWVGDNGPVLSPDGRRLAFFRFRGNQHRAIRAAVVAALAPAGDAVPVTNDPEILAFGERATLFTIGRAMRVVYSAELRDSNLWKIDLTWPGRTPEDAGLVSSTLDEQTPDYAPDGTRVVFASTRSGSEELWISNVDGTALRQVTFLGGPQCSNPRWSPDGQAILFNSTRDGTADLYLLSPAGGELRRLTTDPADEYEAHWSRDGRWVYFGSNRTGRSQIWKMPTEGGSATQITRDGGSSAQESPDRRFLYYAAGSTIRRVPVDGGQEVDVVNGLSYSNNFIVGDRGIYFVAAGATPSATSIDFFEFGTTRRTTLAPIGKEWWFGIALSPDQRWLLFPAIDREGRDLMLVDRMR